MRKRHQTAADIEAVIALGAPYLIVSGEGEQGTTETYKGKVTAREILARLTRERADGQRWARFSPGTDYPILPQQQEPEDDESILSLVKVLRSIGLRTLTLTEEREEMEEYEEEDDRTPDTDAAADDRPPDTDEHKEGDDNDRAEEDPEKARQDREPHHPDRIQEVQDGAGGASGAGVASTCGTRRDSRAAGVHVDRDELDPRERRMTPPPISPFFEQWKIVCVNSSKTYATHMTHDEVQKRLDHARRWDDTLMAVPQEYYWTGQGWEEDTALAPSLTRTAYQLPSFPHLDPDHAVSIAVELARQVLHAERAAARSTFASVQGQYGQTAAERVLRLARAILNPTPTPLDPDLAPDYPDWNPLR